MKIKYRVNPEDNFERLPGDMVIFTRETFNMKKHFELLNLSGSTNLNLPEFGECNGYLGLPKGHKYYGVNYQDIDVSVHGGLTWGQFQEINGTLYWVIGFDTCHFGDNRTNWPKQRVVEELKCLHKQLYEQTK